MADRKFNFNAGPAALPLPVLEEIQRDLVDWRRQGMSILEMSHRTESFDRLIAEARDTIAELYDLPETHEVLFLQGGASLQFAMVPYNLGSGGSYINTGTWSTRALLEARKIGLAAEVWSDESRGFKRVPQPGEALGLPEVTPYLHFTSNNTIYGTQFRELFGQKEPPPRPLVCDMSSDFLSRPVDLEYYDITYAGAQKNAGPAGVTVVIIDKAKSRSFTGADTVPIILQYLTHAKKGSLYNTPNAFGIYVVGLVAKWVRGMGGLAAMAERNASKAARLYAAIDAHPDMVGHADVDSRSHMNVTWRMRTPEQEARLLEAATRRGMVGLKGHRSVGGLRASLYNAVSPVAVDALVDLIRGFDPS